MKVFFTAAVLTAGLAGCTSIAGKSNVNLPKSVVLEFKGKPGETTDTRYYSNARILSYEDGQLVRDRAESVDFTVASHVSEYDPKSKTIAFDVTTTRKDGTVELHDMAFPELNEQIDYVVRGNGDVLKAGHYLPQSLFFVPSMPIPDRAIEIGDTWTMTHTWYSARDAIPLQLDVMGILKDIVPCETNKVCADIEISGHVNLVEKPTTIGSQFKSRLWGRLLFSLERGDVIWSEMRSEENMAIPGQRSAVRSCMISETKMTGDYKSAFACNPNQDEVTKTPKL